VQLFAYKPVFCRQRRRSRQLCEARRGQYDVRFIVHQAQFVFTRREGFTARARHENRLAREGSFGVDETEIFRDIGLSRALNANPLTQVAGRVAPAHSDWLALLHGCRYRLDLGQGAGLRDSEF